MNTKNFIYFIRVTLLTDVTDICLPGLIFKKL